VRCEQQRATLESQTAVGAPVCNLGSSPSSASTSFHLRYLFSFNDAERRAIRTRRRPLNQLGAALHLGFMKMSGLALDALLTHLGRELEIEVPTVTLVRALYRRR
jgi:hypothetical protein